MKKLNVVFALVMLCVFATSFSSCKKSYSCCYAGQCEAVSQEAGETNAAFQNRIKGLKTYGQTCI